MTGAQAFQSWMSNATAGKRFRRGGLDLKPFRPNCRDGYVVALRPVPGTAILCNEKGRRPSAPARYSRN